MVFVVRLRPRNARQASRHGHWTEYLLHGVKISCNVAFVVGSYCFFSGMPEWGDAAGSTLFFVASVVMMFVALLSGMEHLTHLRAHAPEKDDEELNDREASAKYRMLGEVVEEIFYFLGATSYAVGSVLFEPFMEFDEDGLEWAALLFVLGSAFYMAASYQNAMALAYEGMFGNREHRGSGGFVGRQLVKASLFLTQLGAVLFFAGSFLYQGRLGACETGTYPATAIDQGTLMYVLGSCCYLVQSLLSLARTYRLHGSEFEPAAPTAFTEKSRLITELVGRRPGPLQESL